MKIVMDAVVHVYPVVQLYTLAQANEANEAGSTKELHGHECEKNNTSAWG